MHSPLLASLSLVWLAAPSWPQDPSETRPVNRLADQISPYLLQHRHNPVDWYPWGEEALQRARDENKPIFLSIGYAACHWCHVMERESFENPEIAALLNRYFVNIKVDREERPDLDEIYMAAVQAMTGHGGWPMSVWMTPELKPFYAGTYFPPEDGRGMPGFKRVVDHVQRLWNDRRDLCVEQSEKVVEHLRSQLAPKTDPADPSIEFVTRLVEQSASRFDDVHGGFGQPGSFAPKFPHASELQVLLRQHARTGDEQPLKMATKTLVAMAQGGIYDQLGGGFHRYSVDREWLVPHFEKMLYDNSLLAQTYTEAFLLTGDPTFERVVRETLDYLVREMQDPAGGFWSTTDADSEGVEGKFFVWELDQVLELLGEDADAFCLRYGVTTGGNWEGVSILHVAMSIEQVAEQIGVDARVASERIERGRRTLLHKRADRVAPGTDDKVLAAWNGMAIAALAEGFQVFGEPRWLAAAQRAADFVLREMRAGDDGRLLRSWRGGDARLQGYLEDHAFVADGLLRLFESDFDPRWLAEAKRLLDVVDEHFLDETDGNFFVTADDHEVLITRSKSVSESSTPSGIAMAVVAHLRGSLLLGDEVLWERGMRAIRANHAVLSEYPIAAPGLVLAVELALADPREVVIAGEPTGETARAMLARARRAYPPHQVIALVSGSNRDGLAELTPIVAGKHPAADGGAAAYVCRRGACEAPVTRPEALQLQAAR